MKIHRGNEEIRGSKYQVFGACVIYSRYRMSLSISIYLATAGRETQTVPFRESCSMND